MYGVDVSMSVSYPATKKCFEMRGDSKKLSENKGELCQLLVAKLLFVMKSFRNDLETDVSFLKTRVSKSNVDDWVNLRRIMRFLRTYGTLCLCITKDI